VGNICAGFPGRSDRIFPQATIPEVIASATVDQVSRSASGSAALKWIL